MSIADRSFNEKRDYIRMRMDAPVTLLHQGQKLPAICLDLSSTGMLIETQAPLQLGDEVEIQIHSGNAAVADLFAQARVVRANQTATGAHTVGLEVTSMR